MAKAPNDWQMIAARQTSIAWTGDLSDDCSALWAGLSLRAEWMDDDPNYWWWSVTDTELDMEVASSNNASELFSSGEEARAAAESAAQHYLGVRK